MDNYKDFTTVEVASIVAIYEMAHGERCYLHNIMNDVARTFNLTAEEKHTATMIAVEEVTNVHEWSRKCLMDYYERAMKLNDVEYLDIQITAERFIYIKQDLLCIILHNEIERRMK